MRQEDAEAVLASIGEASPQMLKSSRVIRVSLDRVYDFLHSPDAAALKGVGFRIVPDGTEVSLALKLIQSQGIGVGGFAGVPVFQAEGLSVKQGSTKYYPLFLSKADLDVAIGVAQDQRLVGRIQAQEESVSLIRDERNRLADDMVRARNEKERNRFLIKHERAVKKMARAEKRLRDMKGRLSPPQVEVGSLEDVIKHMEEDRTGEWSSVMFVPPGQLGDKKQDKDKKTKGKK